MLLIHILILLLAPETCDLKIISIKEVVKKDDKVVNLNSYIVNLYTNVVINP